MEGWFPGCWTHPVRWVHVETDNDESDTHQTASEQNGAAFSNPAVTAYNWPLSKHEVPALVSDLVGMGSRDTQGIRRIRSKIIFVTPTQPGHVDAAAN